MSVTRSNSPRNGLANFRSLVRSPIKGHGRVAPYPSPAYGVCLLIGKVPGFSPKIGQLQRGMRCRIECDTFWDICLYPKLAFKPYGPLNPMRPLRTSPLTQTLLRWLVALMGILVALTVPVACRDAWVGQDPPAPAEMTVVCQLWGVGLFALVFVVSSFAALRSARLAGIILLATTPVPAFFLAYAASGYVATGVDGEVAYRLPRLPNAVSAALLLYLPFVAASFAIRHRKRHTLLFAATALPIAVFLATCQWAAVFVPRLAGWSAIPVAFGSFWLGTHRLGWPALSASGRRWTAKLAIAAATVLLVAVLLAGGAVVPTALRSSLWTPDCSGPQLFAHPSRPEDIVLTARIVRTAHTQRVAGRWAGSWAIGLVEEGFWGLPSWAPVVLLTNSMYWEDETFFVSGSRTYGLLTRYLPIVDATNCGRHFAVPAADVEPELRLLHEAPSAVETRVVGRVLAARRSSWQPGSPETAILPRPFPSWRNHESKEVYEWGLNGPKSNRPLPGAQIQLTGPSGTSLLTADQDGVYELANLPPAGYTLHLLDVPRYQFAQDLTLKKEALATPGVYRMDLVANWIGSIEGSVTDTDGNPANAIVELRNPDGTDADRSIGEYRIATNGAFRFEHLPAGGRYLVLMNRFGPSVASPYSSLYYPSARRPEGARLIEVRGGEAIGHVDFHVVRRPERQLTVRAVWPDGRPVERGSVTVVNLQPEAAYDHLGGLADEFPTDQNGAAAVRVLGDARVQLRAGTYNPEETEPPFSSDSRPVQLETWRLPASLNLVVPFAPAHRAQRAVP